MNNNRTIQQKDMHKLFPAWEHNIPTLGTKHSQPGNKTARNLIVNDITAHPSRAYGSCLTSFLHPFSSKRAKLERRLVVTLLLMLMLGVGEMWGQSATLPNGDGYYYLINKGAPTDKVWYLKPATKLYDVDMPYLTTNTTEQVPGSLWIIKSNGNFHQIIHAEDMKYVTIHDAKSFGSEYTNNRARMHLEAITTPGDNNDFVFVENGSKYNIKHKTLVADANNVDNKWWNPANNNNTNDNGGSKGWQYLIGLFNGTDGGSLWELTFVKKCVTPEITVDNSGNVTITSVTSGATINYTDDNSDPATSETKKTYTTSFSIGTATKIRAIATKTDFTNSDEASIEKLVSPTVAFDDATQKVTITKNSVVEGAKSVYTTDGNDPIPNSTEYSEAISLTGTTTVKAMNVKDEDGYINSDVVPLTVTKLDSSPTISKEGNTVTLSYTGDGTETIHYTIDGTTPTQESSSYSAPFSLDGDQKFTIKAIATKAGYLNSEVAEEVVDNRNSISAPTITYTGNSVTITASDYGDEVYYTTDGTTPTTDTGTHFTTSGTFNLDNGSNYTIKAIASNGVVSSSEATETIDLTNPGYSGIYYFQNNADGTYYMYPVGGESALVKTAKKTDQNAIWKIERVGDYYHIIHYKDGKYLVAKDLVNGSMPEEETVSLVETDSPGENALFEITRKSGDESDIMQQIILIRPKAAANANGHIYLNTRGGNDGTNTIGLYDNTGSSEWKLATVPSKPTFTVSDIKVTIINTFGAGTIRYTTDGTEPTSSSTSYSNPITLKYGPSYTVKAICVYHDNISGTDWASEVATSSSIKVDLLNPIVTRSGNNVSITNSQASGVTFRYTFSDNGSDPADPDPSGTGTDYESALPLTANARNVFKAIAYNTVDATTYKSNVVKFVVDLRGATTISSLADITSATGSYILSSGFSATGTPKEGDIEIGTSTYPFRGTIDGNLVEFELNSPLFNYVQDATIKNVIISKATISTNGNAGAIAANARGATRIYNCGVLATGSTVIKNDDGYTEITSCSSTISGGNNGNVGGIVGLLDGASRVINCFSYAKITGGKNVGGIVGYNNVQSTSVNQATMVMNCMFYGDIDTDHTTNRAPIYNGKIITNRSDQNGVSNFNYFWAEASYVQKQMINTYNCALAAETRFLQRFEFFRPLLNSNRALAAWWATGSRDNKDEMQKWVMEPSQIGTATPYPILKPFAKYPSVVNLDADHAEEFSGNDATKKTQYNQGRKFGTFTIKIQKGSGQAGDNAPSNASITTPEVYPNITDKDPAHFNFNYYKVQLPYYNDVGTKNYTENKVVTGWKIVSMSKSAGSFTTGSDATATVSDGDITLSTPYNFADRKCTAKDIYSETNKRVFNQGAYFDVPEGVSSITIEPYWGQCVYVSDQYPDVVYNQNMSSATNVTTIGGGERYKNNTAYEINGSSQNVYTTMGNAVTALNPSGSVYDNAIVLVGNVHSLNLSNETKEKPYTIMSIDLDKDNEPDYTYILRFDSRKRVHPVRIDFLNVIGLGMAQKSNGGTGTYNFGIMQPYGWFECTNTGLFRVTQFEYDYVNSSSSGSKRADSPIILQGGVIEQWVTVGGAEENHKEAESVTYYHVGGNVWFKEFHIGVHQDKNLKTNKNPNPDQFVSKHPPISVTGGDYNEFYLTGLYNTPNNNYNDNAECYINGGRFNKVAGTGMQGIGNLSTHENGNITWQIDNADINEFYAGGINAAHISEGNIMTVISNSRVDQFCGGPKFGNMNNGKKVVTNATNCTFRTFFGAGYGGNSYNRRYPSNQNNVTNMNNPTWNGWVASEYTNKYDSGYGGVETRIDYQFIPMSGNTSNVARLFVDYVSFSLATTHDVTSKLTDCTITTSPLGSLELFSQSVGNFYGGGNLGMVDGPVKSTLTNCTVEGNVFGGGYSATLPTVKVMKNVFKTQPHYDANLGAYMEAELPETDAEYTWQHRDEVNSTATAIDKTNHILYTTETLTGLGAVTGNVTLTIDGNTILTNGKVMSVAGSVYGGGEESNVAGNTQVNITGGTITQNVFGGGKGMADEFTCSKAMVGEEKSENACENPGSEANKDKGTIVTISNGQVNGNVYGGGEVGRVEWNTQVKIGVGTGDGPFAPVINGSVFGAGAGVETHGYGALVRGNSTVTIQGDAKVKENVYGGGEQATVGRYWVKGIPTSACDGETQPNENDYDVPNEMPYKTRRGGKCTVTVQGNAQVGPDDGATATAGHVFGAGKGVTPAYNNTQGNEHRSKRMVDYNSSKHTSGEGGNEGQTWDYYPDDHNYVWEYFTTENKYLEFLQTLALVTGTDVTIGGGTVKGNVYGGSESGFVQDDTDVKVSGGTIGTEGTTTYGNIFGGGKGLLEFAEAGKVKGNTGITISGGTTNGNVYGGGELGDVGTIDKTDINNYTWSDYSDEDTTNDTGKCLVSVTNAAATIKGDVFGAGKGSGVTFQCEKAMAYNTEVTISAGTVNGNVYGGGEVGRVENNSKVKIGEGVGVSEGEPTNAPDIKGSVFGAGKGLATHGYSALVRGNTEVTVEGNAKVGTNIYGGGEIASVGRYGLNSEKMPNILLDGGRCIVTVQGYAVVGPENATDDKGNVFGAGRGVDTPYDGTNQRMTLDNENNSVYQDIGSEEAYKSYLETLALATHPEVTIGGHATINGFVFGGGELGLTKGSVVVNINGGTIEKDVYGGGALANTNTTHDVGVPDNVNGGWKKENGEYVTTEVHPTTTVNLKGGLIKGDAYGGGLGQKTGVNDATSDIEAIVYGDVTVELNNSDGTCQVDGSVFGSNNINGTPKGHVKVHVFKTVKAGNTKDPVNETTLDQRWSENANYDLAAVYGGGNKADYKPTSVTDYAEVIIEGCDETSIKEVYGGGYGAAVPATQVKILGAYLINEVFGGGYGAGENNDGANVGYYTYKNEANKTVYEGFADNDGNGKAQVKLYGGKVYTAYGGSNTKGNIRGGSSAGKATDIQVTCSLEVKNIYGAGKNADQDGGTDLVIGCIPGLENVYGGAKDANIKGGVNLVITGGDFVNVFGGNDTSGTIQGPIKVFIEEDCDAINIQNLYLGGNQAAYSVYGYYDDNGTLKPRTSATDTNPVADGTIVPDATTKQYEDPQLYVTKFTSIGNVYGGGYGSGAVMYGNPTVNINEVKKKSDDGIGTIGNVYGGGDAANIIGSTTVNIGTINYALLKHITVGETDVTGYYIRSGAGTTESPYVYNVVTPEAPATVVFAKADTDYYMSVLGANITGNVYGGGKLANVGYLADDTKENDPNSVYCNTFVNIGAQEVTENDTKVWKSVVPGQSASGITILGNVYGGGEGEANENTYKCDKAMVVGNTNVRIGNGTVGTLDNNYKLVEGTGNVYGGGEIGRVEKNSTVTIGFETGTSTPNIKGNVYGAGSGVTTHGYSALVRGNSEVTAQGNAKVDGSVYGGGETASVGRYNIATTQALATEYNVEVGEPYSLISGGKSTVTIQGNAEIGPDDMKMTATGGPDDAGHVFGAGKGVLPYQNLGAKGAGRYYINNGEITWESYSESNEDDYKKYMLTLALSDNTDVTIAGNAFVKGSVYGGSENGHVRTNTLVKIQGGQIGAGYNTSTGQSLSKYSDGQFIDPAITPVTTENALKTCAAWPYDKATTGKPYDMYEGTQSYDSKGGADAAHANDGHTFYGNVFGGGSGYYPYAPGKWLESAGSVGGNTEVKITAGHILSNVYGGNEQTNVAGSCTITMSGGTIGVPRTKEQIQNHPVVGNLFGAGKGDKRVLFNTWTNVASTSITITGGIVYGSVFGGGEDGHVMEDAVTEIEQASGKTITIGSTGESGADGNVFGGGRGSETALTAGVVGGNVSLTINSGTIKGSVYGGGRLASVGTNFVNPDNEELYGKLQAPDADHGNITITINDGTIGNTNSTGVSGNIYGGSKGTTADFRLGIVRSTTINMAGGKAYASVYGGGELAQVVGSHTTGGQALGTEINISGGTIGTEKTNLPEGMTYGATYGNVYGGGKGNTTHVEAGLIKTNTLVSISQAEGKTTTIYHNIYGGGAYGSVGTITTGDATYVPGIPSVSNMPKDWAENTGKAEVYVYGGTIGVDGNENGMVFASSRGDVGTPDANGVDPNNRLAWVHDTKLVIGGEGKSPTIKGSAYGSGENGHVFENSIVEIHNGIIGVTDEDALGGPNYRLRGNVYGGGCGEDTYPETDDFNPLAGIVLGTANVTIDGGQVVHNVYGAGALGSVVGKTTVTIAGSAIIGVNGSVGGNVFGAARGKEGITVAGSNLANSPMTEVNINGGQIWNSVYGGGEAGYVKQGVVVNMTGGVVAKDVYGGGALADTNTDNWNKATNTWADGKSSTSNTTVVNVLGGSVRDVYGGGLGRVADATNNISAVEAFVYGDTKVNLNGLENGDYVEDIHKDYVQQIAATATNVAHYELKTTTTESGTTYSKGAVVNRIFGGNNLNGTPKGNTTVHVFATQAQGKDNIQAKNALHTELEAEEATTTYDVVAVYGGGNEASYIPVYDTTNGATVYKTRVIIEGCDYTSIKTVYGGGNAASVPETNVEIKSAYEIENIFGGGNGKDKKSDGSDNPGADVGTFDQGITTYGTGNANTLLEGGLIHEAYGGSNQKGILKGDINQTSNPDASDCELIMDKVVGAGKYADIDGDVNMILSCQPNRKVNELFAGADEANVNGNITLNITNGHFGNVFGGNNLGGAVKGKITVNVEETGCQPIKIDNLYLGGNKAAYSVYGYYESNEIHDVTGKKILKPRTSASDANDPVANPAEDETHTFPYADPVLNIISCTYIGNVFGGGLGEEAVMYANPTVNVNMVAGAHAATAVPAMMTELGLDVTKTAPNPDKLGIIRNVFGGGDAANIAGNTTVNIATKEGKSAYIIGSVFGGGNAADVLGNTNVTMSGGYVFNGIFGGGYAGNVGTFTRSTDSQYTSVFGHTDHEGCIGKPISCAEGTGKCTVLVNGGQIGPIEVATQGMNRKDAQGHGDPVPQGWVWGAGQGLVEDPAVHKDTHFSSYVGSTDVTIGGTALIMESIIGGGEFGRVLGDTKVTITGNCQIGVGEGQVDANNKPIRYTDAQFVNPLTTTITGGENGNALAECSHFPYGEDTNNDGIKDRFLPYDPYYDDFKETTYITQAHPDLSPASSASPTDGKTWIGCVFAGGSGYMPYLKKDNDGNNVGYDWCSSAGLVEGNTNLTISGGHILTNVYGGNEVTNVKGTCKVTMTGGTIGVPRTVQQIIDHPLTCYLFGAGKGDPRPHFNTETNVQDVEIDISGGIIYGSVFGGGEDGHVERDVKITIGKDDHTGPIIGTWGTSYVDGNIFGGGRGFSGDAYTAGNVAGSVDLDIKGGNILGSVYGGGRLGSVGYGLYDSTADGYGEIRDDKKFDDGTDGSSYFTHGRGHVDIAISGGTIGNRWEYVNVPTDENDLATWKTTNHVPNTEYETTTETIEDKSTTPSTTTTLYHHRLKHTKGGNVFAGGMGRLYQLDGTTPISDVDWWKLGCVKSTKLTITGGTIKSNVYGGGELGQVVGYHTTKNAANESINASTEIIIPDDNTTIIGTEVKDGSNNTQYTFGSVFGGGYGSLIEKIEVQRGTSTISSYPKFIAGFVKEDTKIDMQDGKVKACIYGGGEMASVGESTTSGETTTVTGSTYVAISGGTVGIAPIEVSGTKRYFGGAKMGNVYGGGSGHGNTVRSGRVLKNTNVTISGSDTRIYHNIYGGGAYGTVGEFKYTEDPNNYNKVIGVEKLKTSGTGVATVTITGGTIGYDGKENGMVFGSSRGDVNAPNERDDHTAWVYDANVTIGTQGSETGPAIKGSVYGSGENGHTFHNTDVKVHSGTIGITDTSIDGGAAYAYRGNVYGGGCGTDKYYEDPTQETHDGNGQLYNPLAGIVYGNATVTMDGGHVVHNVYGAGAMGSVGKASDAASGKTTINISGGRIGYDGEGNGHVFGAARGEHGVSTAASNLANVRETEVNINYAATPAGDTEGKTAKLIAGSVFGGGEAGTVKGSVAVNMTGGLILKDIYGGGALADTQTAYSDNTSYTTTVNLLGGTIGGDAYGGGLGQKNGFNGGNSDIEATVYGDITVNLGSIVTPATEETPAVFGPSATKFNISYENTDEKDDQNNYIQVVKSGRVFGCNNLNGSPQGDVTVNVYKTVADNVSRTASENYKKKEGEAGYVVPTYEVAAVYGGGNLANYTASGKKANVVIHSCDVSVQYVYGGGNAAAVPGTDVYVKGAYEIDHVFGGGNGKDKYKKGNEWMTNAGANVTGNTNTLLIGGYIHEAYGGSNEKGTISGNVTINTKANDPACVCDLDLEKLYGAGKNADIEGDLIVVLDCAPETRTEEIYGGAENANVKGNVELTITSGSFGKVFGGNNQSGSIFGHIILNVEETSCRPIVIDQLYGCGYNAAYSVYGYKNGGTDNEGYPIYVPRTSSSDGTAVTFEGKPHTVPNATTGQYDDPEVNIISCTRIGQVFGGGLGAGATVYGNPTVNINQIYGKAYVDNDPTKDYTATATTLGVIGEVFGGGNEANVVGNTNVNIGTKDKVKLHLSVNAEGTYTWSEDKTVVGANITGNVYGGGNNAEVTGNTNVTIGK